MKRRNFLRTSAMGGLGLLVGCGKDKPTSSGEGSGSGGNGSGSGGSGSSSGSGSGGSGSSTTWDSYVPRVNDEPYFQPEYFVGGAISDSVGQTAFFYGGKLIPFQIRDAGNGRFVSGLEASLFMEFRGNTGDMLVTDPQRRYMPRVMGLSQIPGTSSKLSLQQSDSLMEVPPRGWFPEIKGMLVSKISARLPNPSYNSNYDLDGIPGIVYRGHWSIEDLVKVTSIAKKGSLVLIPLDGGATYSILSKTETIGNDLTEALDFINSQWPESKKFVTKDKNFIPIYSGHGGLPEHLLIGLSAKRMSEEDIRYLFPINEGSYWTFSDGMQTETMKVIGKKRVKGRQLVVVNQTSGIEEYFGFEGNSWNYYGFNFPPLGEIFFEPALKIGDNRIRVGSRFQTSSKIVSNVTGLSGTAREDYQWISREDVLLSDGTSYGDCFRVRESFSFELAKGGERASDGIVGDRWIAKNVGPVKLSVSQKIAELTDYEIVSRAGPSQNSNKIIYPSRNIDLFGVSPLPKRFLESLKKLV